MNTAVNDLEKIVRDLLSCNKELSMRITELEMENAKLRERLSRRGTSTKKKHKSHKIRLPSPKEPASTCLSYQNGSSHRLNDLPTDSQTEQS
jgi:regulator of replication initiation timing